MRASGLIDPSSRRLPPGTSYGCRLDLWSSGIWYDYSPVSPGLTLARTLSPERTLEERHSRSIATPLLIVQEFLLGNGYL